MSPRGAPGGLQLGDVMVDGIVVREVNGDTNLRRMRGSHEGKSRASLLGCALARTYFITLR